MKFLLALAVLGLSVCASADSTKLMSETSSALLGLNGKLTGFRVCSDSLGYHSTSAYFYQVLECSNEFKGRTSRSAAAVKLKKTVITNLRLIFNTPEYKHCVGSLGHYNVHAAYDQALECAQPN